MLYIILFYSLFFVSSLFAKVISQQTQITHVEKVNGKVFKHIVTSGDSVSEQFFIDEVPMLKEMYFEKLEDEERDEIHQKRMAKQDRVIAQAQSLSDVQVDLAVKLAQTEFEKVQELFEHFHMPVVQKHITYMPSAIASPQQFREIADFIEQSKYQLQEAILQRNSSILHNLHENFEEVKDKLEGCLHNSVSKAIAHCDDTYALKELFRIMSTLEQK